MDLTLWDASFDQATEESSNQIITGLEHDLYFDSRLDVIEQSALNEKSCVQVLKKLITKADDEIAQLEDDLVMLQVKLALDDGDFSQLCSIALRQKIDCLDIAVKNLKNGSLDHECDLTNSLQKRGEPSDRLHDLLKVLLTNFSHEKEKRFGDIICQKASSDQQGQEIQLLVEQTQTGNSASNSVRNLPPKDTIISYADKNASSKNNLQYSRRKTRFYETAQLANTTTKDFILDSSRPEDSLVKRKRSLSNLKIQRAIKVEPSENSLIPADVRMIQNSPFKTLINRKNQTESLNPQPLAIILPSSSSDGVKLANQKSKDIIPQKKDSTDCNLKKKPSKVLSRIAKEEIVAQSCAEKDVILLKPVDMPSSSFSFSEKDSNIPQSETDSLLQLLYKNETLPRSKKTRVRKIEEPDPNTYPETPKRRKTSPNYSFAPGKTTAVVKLEDDDAEKMLSCSNLLYDLTVIELKKIARQRGIIGYSRFKKAELVQNLELSLNNRGKRKGKM